jgi:hypothetical protein
MRERGLRYTPLRLWITGGRPATLRIETLLFPAMLTRRNDPLAMFVVLALQLFEVITWPLTSWNKKGTWELQHQ